MEQYYNSFTSLVHCALHYLFDFKNSVSRAPSPYTALDELWLDQQWTRQPNPGNPGIQNVTAILAMRNSFGTLHTTFMLQKILLKKIRRNKPIRIHFMVILFISRCNRLGNKSHNQHINRTITLQMR